MTFSFILFGSGHGQQRLPFSQLRMLGIAG
jgi:hypothetical protein